MFRLRKKKKILKKGCPDCGFFVACDKCSEKMDQIDIELSKKGL